MDEVALFDCRLNTREQTVEIGSESGNEHADNVPWLDVALWIDCRSDLLQELQNYGQSQGFLTPSQIIKMATDFLSELKAGNQI